MKKRYLVIGLKEVPLLDGYGDERQYIVSVHLDTFNDVNDAEGLAVMEYSNYEHGIEIKTVYQKTR